MSDEKTLSDVLPKKEDHNPHVIVVIGMAGTGKSSFISALYKYLYLSLGKRVYVVNLDPAVLTTPFPANIDIRDTVNYKEVMKQYCLGPNGAIMTCLNLFATRFDKVLDILERRRQDLDYILVDTPGQIEVFNWSASGNIILDTLAVSFPTSISFLIDSHQCGQHPNSFMANMLYACSVLYKSKLPFVATFNKIDVSRHEKLLDWMSDPEKFTEKSYDDDSYSSTLSRSCAWSLCELYKVMNAVGVSAITGDGLDVFVKELEKTQEEYFEFYQSWLHQQKKLLDERKAQKAKAEFSKFQKQLKEDLNDPTVSLEAKQTLAKRFDEDDRDNDDDDEDDHDDHDDDDEDDHADHDD